MTSELDAPALFIRTTGSGPDIVFCHGFAGSGRNWGIQVRALSASHRCTVYDARGHARSPAPADPAAYAFDCFVDDVGRVLDAVGGVDRALLVGLSFGAATALEFALRNPERVSALVLASPPPTGDERRRWARDFAEAIEHDGAERAGERFIWGERARLDVEGARRVRLGFLEHDPRALTSMLRNALSELPELDEQAARLESSGIPTVIVAGERDATSVPAARLLAQKVPSSELFVIAGAGHVVNLAAPSEFLSAVQRAVEKAGSRRRDERTDWGLR